MNDIWTTVQNINHVCNLESFALRARYYICYVYLMVKDNGKKKEEKTRTLEGVCANVM